MLAELEKLEYPVADDAITELAEEYLSLHIADVNDSEGFKLVHEARMNVKKKRVAIEKTRKQLKKSALEYGRKVDDEAKRLTALIAPIEEHLSSEEDAYNAERDRIRQEEEQKHQAMLRERVRQLAEYGVTAMTFECDGLPDEEFAEWLDKARTEHEAKLAAEAAEKQRREAEEKASAERHKLGMARLKEIYDLGQPVESWEELADLPADKWESLVAEAQRQLEQRKRLEEEEAAKRKAEAEKLAAERAEIERQRAEAEADRKRLEEERQRIHAEQEERKRQEAIEAQKKEAAERAVREAEAKRQQEAEEAQRRADAEKAEQDRLAALRPDHEKLMAFARQVLDLDVPILSDAKESIAAHQEVCDLLEKAGLAIKAVARRLSEPTKN